MELLFVVQIWIVVLLNSWFVSAEKCASPSEVAAFLHKALSPQQGYNKMKIPGESPFPVQVDMWVQDINFVSTEGQNFETELFISMYWDDAALSYENLNPCRPSIAMDAEFAQNTWNPMMTFVNAAQSSVHKSPFPNLFTLVYPNGTMWSNTRFKVQGPCKIDFSKFPLSKQTCSLSFESYMYGNQDIMVDWKGDIFLINKMTLEEVTLNAIKSTATNEDYPAGSWRQLAAIFEFERNNGCKQLFRYYAPQYLTIFLLWINFFLGDKVIVRTLICIYCVVATTMTGYNADIPRVNYFTAFDLWLIGSMVFTLYSIVEMVIVASYKQYSHGNRGRQGRNMHLDHDIDQPSNEEYKKLFETNSIESAGNNDQHCLLKLKWTDLSVPEKYDWISCLFIFPLAFLVFNVCYWMWFYFA